MTPELCVSFFFYLQTFCEGEVEQAASPKEKKEKNDMKKKTRAIDLPLVAKVPQMSRNEINFFIEQEVGFKKNIKRLKPLNNDFI